MPQVCTICKHAQRSEIDASLIDGASFRHIASRYDTSTGTLQRHKNQCLGVTLSKATDAREVMAGENLLAELSRHAKRLHSLSDACHEWLTDPDNPTRYTLEPRSSEVNVIYFKQDGVLRQRKKQKLSVLLGEIETGLGVEVERGEYKHADPRELILKTYDRIQGQLELIAKLVGQLDETPKINVNVTVETLQAVIITALHPFPEARLAVSQALMEAKL